MWLGPIFTWIGIIGSMIFLWIEANNADPKMKKSSVWLIIFSALCLFFGPLMIIIWTL